MCQRQNGDSGLQFLDLKYHDLGYVSFHSCLAAQRCAKTTISLQLSRWAKNGCFFHRPLFVCGLWQMRCVLIVGFSLFHLLCASSAILQISQQYRGNSLLVLLSLMLLSLLLLSLFGSDQPHLGRLPRDLLLEAWIYSQVLFHLSRLLFLWSHMWLHIVSFLWSHIVSIICCHCQPAASWPNLCSPVLIALHILPCIFPKWTLPKYIKSLLTCS